MRGEEVQKGERAGHLSYRAGRAGMMITSWIQNFVKIGNIL